MFCHSAAGLPIPWWSVECRYQCSRGYCLGISVCESIALFLSFCMLCLSLHFTLNSFSLHQPNALFFHSHTFLWPNAPLSSAPLSLHVNICCIRKQYHPIAFFVFILHTTFHRPLSSYVHTLHFSFFYFRLFVDSHMRQQAYKQLHRHYFLHKRTVFVITTAPFNRHMHAFNIFLYARRVI